jgi:hypothetical protein
VPLLQIIQLAHEATTEITVVVYKMHIVLCHCLLQDGKLVARISLYPWATLKPSASRFDRARLALYYKGSRFLLQD